MASRHSPALAAGSNWLAYFATLLVSFFLTPTLIRSLGPPRYDVWYVVEQVLAYLTLLDLGIAACLVRNVARLHAADEREGLNRVAASCLAAFTGAGAGAFVAGGAALALLAGRLEAKAGHPGDVLPFMLVMLLNVALSLPLGVFASVLDGLQRYPEKSAVRLVALAGRTVGILLVVRHGGGLLPLALVLLAASLAEQLALLALAYRYLPGLSFHPRRVDRATLKLVRVASTDAFLAMLAGRMTTQTGSILIGFWLPAGEVTRFANGTRLVEYAKNLLRNVTSTLTPGVSALEARGDWPAIRALYLNATRWVLYAAVPIQVGLYLFGAAFLTRWLGPDLARGSGATAALLASTVALGMAQSVASRILYGLGQLKLFARLALAEAGLNVVLSFALVGPFGVGGVAFGIALPNVLFSLAVLVVAARILGVKLGDYLAAWARPLGLTLVPLAIWLSLGDCPAEWPALVKHSAAGMIPYVLAVAASEGGVGFTRRVARRLLRRAGRRFGGVGKSWALRGRAGIGREVRA